jgi:hypothetical protein
VKSVPENATPVNQWQVAAALVISSWQVQAVIESIGSPDTSTDPYREGLTSSTSLNGAFVAASHRGRFRWIRR